MGKRENISVQTLYIYITIIFKTNIQYARLNYMDIIRSDIVTICVSYQCVVNM